MLVMMLDKFESALLISLEEFVQLFFIRRVILIEIIVVVESFSLKKSLDIFIKKKIILNRILLLLLLTDDNLKIIMKITFVFHTLNRYLVLFLSIWEHNISSFDPPYPQLSKSLLLLLVAHHESCLQYFVFTYKINYFLLCWNAFLGKGNRSLCKILLSYSDQQPICLFTQI